MWAGRTLPSRGAHRRSRGAHQGIDDELFDRLRTHFADDEILDLTLCLAVYLGLGRTLEVLQITEATDLDV